MSLEVECTPVTATTSMPAFLNCTDLMSLMFGFITEKEDKQSATLVCKGWRELSETFPTWRKARLTIKYENGSYLEQKKERVREPFWDELEETSMSTIEGMLTHRKHIRQYDLICQYRSIDWWADLATFMPHLTWLSLCVGQGVYEMEETPFALEGLPNLTYLSLVATYHCFGSGKHLLSSLSLRLPVLQTLELEEHGDKEYAMEVR